MLHSCALVFFLCACVCLATIGLFSDRWMLVEASVPRPGTSGNVSATTFVAVGLWETKRVAFYHFYYHHRPHEVLVYHETVLADRRSVGLETPEAPANSTGLRANWRSGIDHPVVSEATLKRLTVANNGALVAARVLLFGCLALGLAASIKLMIDACGERGLVRHRYKERVLAATVTALCAGVVILSITAWSVFLGTMYSAVLRHGETSEVLSSGFICSVLASLTAAVAAGLAACSITATED